VLDGGTEGTGERAGSDTTEAQRGQKRKKAAREAAFREIAKEEDRNYFFFCFC
jgi:hypothetical protein